MILKKIITGVLFVALFQYSVKAQGFFQNSKTYNSGRVTGVVIAESAVSTLATIGLSYLWYKKFPHSRFHYFNDNAEWLQIDKVGHATSAYNIAALQGNIMEWSGVKRQTAGVIGSLTALGFMSMIEIMDGHSAAWGFSKGDMLANITGCLIYEGQELMWHEQRLGLKISFHRTLFAKYNPDELGSNLIQQMLKDYNGQTYWLSCNVASFLPSNTKFPQWFNVNAGYGGEGMTAAIKNPTEVNGKPIPEFTRYRQFYLSVDADLYRIKSMPDFPDAMLKVNRLLKVPAPTLEWNPVQGWRGHLLYY